MKMALPVTLVLSLIISVNAYAQIVRMPQSMLKKQAEKAEQLENTLLNYKKAAEEKQSPETESMDTFIIEEGGEKSDVVYDEPVADLETEEALEDELNEETTEIEEDEGEAIEEIVIEKPSLSDLLLLRPAPDQAQVNVNVDYALVQQAVSPGNQIYSYHFDPKNTYKVDQEIEDEFLRERGIKEVIGVGVSDFGGSKSTRVHNIRTAMKRFDGVIVPRGHTFSFNTILDNVHRSNGYVEEGVILDGEFKKALGGGICQLSSTVFRSTFNAGLPITERRNHSYAFDMYWPHGLDATIYLGSQDFKFKNDTPGDILIKTKIQGQKLIVVYYGTRDRQVNMARTSFWQNGRGGLTTKWRREVKDLAEGDVLMDETVVSNYKKVY